MDKLLYDTVAAATAAAAGTVTLSATVPEIVKFAREPRLGAGVVLERTRLQAAGNALWVLHALWTCNLWLGIMTGIGCALALVLYAQGVRGRRLVGKDRKED